MKKSVVTYLKLISFIKKTNLTLFWLSFFMYVKWLGGGNFYPLPKVSTKRCYEAKICTKTRKIFLTKSF